MKLFLIRRSVSGREGEDFYIVRSKNENLALRKVAKKLYKESHDPTDLDDLTFEEYFEQCLTTDCGDILEIEESVEEIL